MNNATKKTAWVSWERMGRSKTAGGMGFRDLQVFNTALLAKQGWRLMQHPDSMVATVMRNISGKSLSYKPL